MLVLFACVKCGPKMPLNAGVGILFLVVNVMLHCWLFSVRVLGLLGTPNASHNSHSNDALISNSAIHNN